VGAYDPKFERGQDFCTMHLTTNFHHPMSEVIVLTNKQTLLKTSTLLCYATPVGNNQVIFLQSSQGWKKIMIFLKSKNQIFLI